MPIGNSQSIGLMPIGNYHAGMVLMVTAVRRALRTVPLMPADGAAAELALHYAVALDAGAELDELGPKLLAALESLGMTPRARRALVKEASANGPRSPLDELRERRRTRDTG